MSTDPPVHRTVRRVQNAAIERALFDGDRQHLAFAGALESLRREAAREDTGGLVAPLLACTALAAGNGSTQSPGSAWVPSGGREDRRAEGAALAVRRFGVDVDRAAALAGRPVAEVRTALQRYGD